MCCVPRERECCFYIDDICCCFPRRFLTKKEKIERIKKYIERLESEIAGAKEFLEQLKKESK